MSAEQNSLDNLVVDPETLASLRQVADSDSNILIVGGDKELNAKVLKAINHERREAGTGLVVVKGAGTSDNFRLMYPRDQITVINAPEIKSVLDVRNILKEMWDFRLAITDISTSITAELFILCCEGLRSDVVASYTCDGDLDQCLVSLAKLNQPEKGHLPFELTLERVVHLLEAIVKCDCVDGQPIISVIRK
ncbi:hypothetical protein AV654_19825 [Paenibacillus elgii]|uniref:Uncharacterized protein n=1 Tax=Paenibacillus elgii TaxID=189691 RepID=A0A161SCQ4_9BACL|nr:hypothetical protein [Paenibacillus elgii]KZE78225.1 hypothetical protein AV654_19825 [Paenibacillus elgii]